MTGSFRVILAGVQTRPRKSSPRRAGSIAIPAVSLRTSSASISALKEHLYQTASHSITRAHEAIFQNETVNPAAGQDIEFIESARKLPDLSGWRETLPSLPWLVIDRRLSLLLVPRRHAGSRTSTRTTDEGIRIGTLVIRARILHRATVAGNRVFVMRAKGRWVPRLPHPRAGCQTWAIMSRSERGMKASPFCRQRNPRESG